MLIVKGITICYTHAFVKIYFS